MNLFPVQTRQSLYFTVLESIIESLTSGNRKAKKKAKKLNQQAEEANERAMSSFELRADNIDKQNDFNLLAN